MIYIYTVCIYVLWVCLFSWWWLERPLQVYIEWRRKRQCQGTWIKRSRTAQTFCDEHLTCHLLARANEDIPEKCLNSLKAEAKGAEGWGCEAKGCQRGPQLENTVVQTVSTVQEAVIIDCLRFLSMCSWIYSCCGLPSPRKAKSSLTKKISQPVYSSCFRLNNELLFTSRLLGLAPKNMDISVFILHRKAIAKFLNGQSGSESWCSGVESADRLTVLFLGIQYKGIQPNSHGLGPNGVLKRHPIQSKRKPEK